MRVLGDFTTSIDRALSEIDPHWMAYEGLVVGGTHKPQQVDLTLTAIRDAREQGIPTLLICWGHQMGAIEYARNVLGIEDATSEEWDTKGTFVVKKRDGLKVGLHDGESWWSNYEVAIEWEKPSYFFSTPSHPEYQSSLLQPHNLLVDFITYAKMADTNRS